MFTHGIDEGLELRLYDESDADELFVVVDADRAHLRQWLPWLDRIKGVEDERAFIRASREQFAKNNGFSAGIWHDGRFVGSVGLHYIDRANRKTEIGYWLAESAQGKGIMTRAVRAVLREMFEAQNLNRVILYAATENRRSRAVAERAGFTLEGIAREAEWLYDHFVDLAIYSMLAREWRE